MQSGEGVGDALLGIGKILLAVFIIVVLFNLVGYWLQRRSRVREIQEQIQEQFQRDAVLKARYPDLYEDLQERKEMRRELEHDRLVRRRVQERREAEERRRKGYTSDDDADMAFATRRQWRAAIRSVGSEIPKGETLHAEGPGAYMFSDQGTGMWVEAHIAVTENRIAWALPKGLRAGVLSMLFDQVVKHVDQEPGVVALTTRDPEYAAMLDEPGNPYGEVDAVFRFDFYESRVSTEIRGFIALGVADRGTAVTGSLSDYL